MQAGDGNIYGIGRLMYPSFAYLILKIDPSGGVSEVHTFDPAIGYPLGAMIVGSDGGLYGAMSSYQHPEITRVYKMTTAGAYSVFATYTGAWNFATTCTLTLGPDGTLYGTAGQSSPATIFRVSTAGVTSVVVQMNGADNSHEGFRPAGGLTRAPDGTLYGTTTLGGGSGAGTVFNVSPAG